MDNQIFIYKKKRPTLIYNLGSEAGFFSEFNNMVLAIIYCYKNNINFKLYSKTSNFGYEKGWEDYFEPFCIEVTEKYHSKYNIRQVDISSTKDYNKLLDFYYKIKYRFDYYTYELWPYFHNKTFENEEITINNDHYSLLEATNYIIKLIWIYNRGTKQLIDSLIRELKLPEVFVSIHIRKGDKYQEAEIISEDRFIEKLQQHTNIKNVFVLTDDYSVINNLRNKYQDYFFYSFCKKGDDGYVHNDFVKLDKQIKRIKICMLLASMDIIRKSELLIGSYSSNPGMFIGMCSESCNIIDIDDKKWTIW